MIDSQVEVISSTGSYAPCAIPKAYSSGIAIPCNPYSINCFFKGLLDFSASAMLLYSKNQGGQHLLQTILDLRLICVRLLEAILYCSASESE